jgi:hypothetical protein
MQRIEQLESKSDLNQEQEALVHSKPTCKIILDELSAIVAAFEQVRYYGILCMRIFFGSLLYQRSSCTCAHIAPQEASATEVKSTKPKPEKIKGDPTPPPSNPPPAPKVCKPNKGVFFFRSWFVQ